MTLLKSGWLRVREAGDVESKPFWCVLDNGVLWLSKSPGDQQGREAVPLHDAVVGDSDPPAPMQLVLRCRRSGRVLALTAITKEEYTEWIRILSESVREWREKRRASVLNRQLMAIVAENEKNGIINTKPSNLLGEIPVDLQFTPRRRSEVPRPTSRLFESSLPQPGATATTVKRLPLKQLVATTKTPIRWSKLKEVIDSGLLGLLNEEQVAMEEIKFSALVEEVRFSAEMSVLLRLATRAVSWPDELPAFNRRCIVHSLTKVKRSSDSVLRKAESQWAQRVTMQTSVFSLFGTEARVFGWCQAYTDYCLYLDELRELLQRQAHIRDNLNIQSSRYGLELALVPIQHLTTLRQLLQTIFELLPPDSSEHIAARETRDSLNEILDSCYEELTEQSGSVYVAEMDNILQFDLSAVSSIIPGPQLLFKKKDQQSQSPTGDDDDVMSDEEEKKIIRKMTKSSRPSIFKTAANTLRRLTAEGLGLRENRSASLPAVMFTLPPAESDEGTDEEEEDIEEEEETNSEVLLAVPRYFCFEPLYQNYCLSLAEEIVDRTLGRIDEDTVKKSEHKPKGCTSWSQNPRVLESGFHDTVTEDQRSLMDAKFEIIVSEAAYLRSLRTLESHFAHCPEFYDEDILPPVERHLFFSSVESHRTSSERLLASLERCWIGGVMLDDMCSVLHRHMTSATARVSATACLNQLLVAHVLQNLSNKNDFVTVLTKLEAGIISGGFTLLSFLILPLKRLGRIKIMLENISRIMSRLPEVKISERAACESAKDAAGRLLARGETASKRTLSDAALQELAQKLSFRRVPRIALSAEGRALLHQGAWRVLGRREDLRGGMRAKTMYPDLQAFLLSDLLVLAAPDGAGNSVVDYCACSELTLCTAGPGMDEPLPGFLEKDPGAKNALYVSFRNHAGKIIELIVGCNDAAERERWLFAFNSELIPPSPIPGRQLTLVRALRSHAPRQPDEANLAPGDIIAVLRNPGDGWILGRSVLDGTGGWFPSSLTVQLSTGRKSVTFLVSEIGKTRFSLA